MLGLSALELARIQFGFTISFHIIFPAITIGLASYLVVLEGLWVWRKDTVYRDLYHFWSRIFAVNFGMGVVSGLVMAYQFGTNWSYFSRFAGSVTGPLLTYEVLTAFFLEAGFLGVMLFGWNKVGPGLHVFATIMVAIGTLLSATWILASNSWLHTPQGFEIVNGRVVPVHWLQVIFNPSFPYRLAHMTLAAYLATALFVGASGAWHLLRGRATPANCRMLSMAMWMILAVTPIQMGVGDAHGLNTLKYEPAKIAAVEGHWANTPGESVPLILFGLPDMTAETTHFAIEVPYLGSLLLTHDLHGQIPGLKDFAPEDRPNSSIIFWTFRVMVGLGVLMFLLSLWSLLLRWRVQFPAFPALCHADGADGADRDPCRLADDRDRPAALGGLRCDAHQGCGVEPFGLGPYHDSDHFHRHVLRRVWHRHQLHAEAGRQRTRRSGRRERSYSARQGPLAAPRAAAFRGSRPYRSGDQTLRAEGGMTTWVSIFLSCG